MGQASPLFHSHYVHQGTVRVPPADEEGVDGGRPNESLLVEDVEKLLPGAAGGRPVGCGYAVPPVAFNGASKRLPPLADGIGKFPPVGR